MRDDDKTGAAGKRKRPPVAKHLDPYGGKKTDVTEPVENERGVSLIEGRNAVIEALRAGVQIDKVYMAKGETDATLGHIASKAREAGAVVSMADRRKLDFMSVTHAHQGVIATVSAVKYAEVSDILDAAKAKGEAPLIIICDEITDPHNLGAIIRTAEASGAHGVIIPKRRSAGLGATVSKASAGAVYHVPVARVANLASVIAELKKQGVWIFGTASDGDTALWQADLTMSAAIVVGSEGEGMGRLVGKCCDYSVSIPMRGEISSLNASVSAAILMYEAVRQRSGSRS